MEKALTLVLFFFLVKCHDNFSYHVNCFYGTFVLSVVDWDLFEHCMLLNSRQSDTK